MSASGPGLKDGAAELTLAESVTVALKSAAPTASNSLATRRINAYESNTCLTSMGHRDMGGVADTVTAGKAGAFAAAAAEAEPAPAPAADEPPLLAPASPASSSDIAGTDAEDEEAEPPATLLCVCSGVPWGIGLDAGKGVLNWLVGSRLELLKSNDADAGAAADDDADADSGGGEDAGSDEPPPPDGAAADVDEDAAGAAVRPRRADSTRPGGASSPPSPLESLLLPSSSLSVSISSACRFPSDPLPRLDELPVTGAAADDDDAPEPPCPSTSIAS